MTFWCFGEPPSPLTIFLVRHLFCGLQAGRLTEMSVIVDVKTSFLVSLLIRLNERMNAL